MNDEQTINALRAAILRFFLADDAQQVADFLMTPSAQPHRPRDVRAMIVSMAHAGLLTRWGRTSGVCYQTAHLGFVVLATLENEPSRTKAAGSRLRQVY